MLFASTKNMRWKLIELLVRKRRARAEELWQAMIKSGRTCSLQAIYLHLRSLQSDGVVVRARGVYSIGLWWAYEFLTVAGELERHITSVARSQNLLPRPDTESTWKFFNLIQLDDLWVQLITASFAASKVQAMHTWIPHPWYYFAQREKIKNFYNILVRKKIRYYGILGGTGPLDVLYMQEAPPKLLDIRRGIPSFVPGMGVHECVIGPFIITVKLAQRIAKELDTFFIQQRSLYELDLRKLFYILTSKYTSQISIVHNSKTAERKRQAYQEFFSAASKKRAR